jgi:mono/diheme cytochrome c family protein
MHRNTTRSRTHAALARSLNCCLALAAAAAVTWAQAQPAAEVPATRGQLLYSTHCIECHTTQMHWRNQRQARDWETLKAQVRRWQGVASLGWSEADIDDVARHLNDTIYKFPHQVSSVGRESGLLAAALPGRTRVAANAP